MRKIRNVGLIFILLILIFARSAGSSEIFRGSIPEILLRPGRTEPPRFPSDTVIGELGRGRASVEAYNFARFTANRILARNLGSYGLENYLTVFQLVNPYAYRIGSGRTEPDGAVSFLIRFVGREHGVTGELFVRYVTRNIVEAADEETEETITRTTGEWVFEDLLLEDVKARGEESREFLQLYDFSPYQRFF